MDAQFYFNQGIEKSRQKDFLGAIQDYTTAIKLSSSITPDTVIEKPSKFITISTNVFNINEGFTNIYFNRGLAYMDIGKYPEAYEDFSKVIDYDPNDAEAYFQRAITNYCLEDDIESNKDVKKAYSLDSKYTEAFFWSKFQK